MRTGSNSFKALALATLICFCTSTAAMAGYTPGELNPLLGRPVLMDITTCAQRYGHEFCTCVELQDGTIGCHYRRPAPGFYSLERCEQIWGQGYCECPQEDMCQLRQEANVGNPVGCSGQIYIFPGSSDDCNRAGIRTSYRNCCEESEKQAESCSFQNIAKELGWDDAAIALAEAVASHYAKEELANFAGKMAVEYALENGAFDFATTAISSIFGSGAPSVLANSGGVIVVESGAQTFATSSATLAAEYMASAFLAAFSFVTWAYMIYTLYSMYDEMTKCTAAEKILSCKRAKGVCHKVGNRCSIKVFGACLQTKEIFCCFDSVLSRIIHEQGRPQIGLDWGDADSPTCRGFYLDEFMQIDFTKIDFGEYVDDLTRQMLNPAQVESKVRTVLEKYASEMGGDIR